jgi:hypothetical protein
MPALATYHLGCRMTTPHERIQAGAAIYLESFNDQPGKSDELLSLLRNKCGWTPAEILSLQSRAIEILLGHGKKEGESASPVR